MISYTKVDNIDSLIKMYREMISSKLYLHRWYNNTKQEVIVDNLIRAKIQEKKCILMAHSIIDSEPILESFDVFKPVHVLFYDSCSVYVILQEA